MKDIKEYFNINESLNKETYYVIKIKSGKAKNSYITADAEWYKDITDINKAYKGKDLNDIKEFKTAFDEETNGSFGDSIIIQVDVTYKEI